MSAEGTENQLFDHKREGRRTESLENPQIEKDGNHDESPMNRANDGLSNNTGP